MTTNKAAYILPGSVLLAASMIFQLAAFASTARPEDVSPDCIHAYCYDSSTCGTWSGGNGGCSCQGVTSPSGTGSNPGGQGMCE